MVQTEACRPSGAHIYSEKVAIFGVANLYIAKKGAQKYKKYDTKMRLCTVSMFPPIWKCFKLCIICPEFQFPKLQLQY